MGSELKIKVLAELAGVEKLSEKFKILAAAAKDADYQFRQGKMSSDQLKASLASIQKIGDSLNGTYKQNVDLTATLYQVQQRANVGFKSLAVSLDEISNKMQKTNPAFVSFNQIVQDAPFGIRGVGNNIQFLTQQFTQLRSTGMQTNEILKGMIGNALQPMGLLMLAVSVGTSLLTVAMDALSKEAKVATDETGKYLENLKKINKEQGLSSEAFAINAQLDLAQRELADAKRVVDEMVRRGVRRSALSGSPFMERIDAAQGKVDELRGRQQESIANQIAYQTSKLSEQVTLGDITLSQQKNQLEYLLRFEKNEDNRRALRLEILAIEKQITEEQEKRFSNALKRRVSDRDFMDSTFATSSGVRAYDSASWDKVSGSRKFGQIDPMTDKLSGVRVKASNEIRSMDETMADIFKEDVKKMADAYNSFLFDPIKAGTRALAGEIHQSLFGAMDDLERKFGRVGASMVGALEGVISKLIEAVMWSAVMSFVPGSQTFGQIFMNTVGLGGKGTTGRTNLANLSTPKRAGENVVLVEVQGKLGNDAIYLAGKNFIGRQKVATL